MNQADLPALKSEQDQWDESALGRRKFLNIILWTVTGISALAVGAPAARFLIGNSFEARAGKWVKLGKLSELDPNAVNRVNYSMRALDAWREVQQTGALYAFSPDGGASYVVLDGACTHLGCIVQWRPERNHFACPCHAGYFTREGEVIEGPPPRPLRRLETKIEDDALWAKI